MFTIKLIGSTDNSTIQEVFSATSYRKEEYEDRVDLIADDRLFIVSRKSKDFELCFIENSAGKTIDTIRASADQVIDRV